MNRYRLRMFVVVILALGAATAAATPPKGVTLTELARSTITGPISVSAIGDSDLAGQMVTYPAGGFVPWHSHPGPTFLAVKSGTLTRYHGGAQGCTSTRYSAGQGFLESAGDVNYVKNEGSTPAEVYVTFIVPVGAELLKTEANPGGVNCPSETTGGPALTRTDLGRSKVSVPVSVQATAASDVAMEAITVEPGGFVPWHSHPAVTLVALKSGTLTEYHSNAAGCTSHSDSPGQGHFHRPGEVHMARNEGSTPVELYVTYLAAPVGAELLVEVQNPGGANCPDPNPSPQGASRLPRTGSALAGLLTALGVGLAGAGTAARSLARRRWRPRCGAVAPRPATAPRRQRLRQLP